MRKSYVLWLFRLRGIQKICESCLKHGSPEPEFEVLGGDITVRLTALRGTAKKTTQSTTQLTKK